MLTTYPPCPVCQEDDLFRVDGPQVRVKCADCGYDTGVLGMASRPDVAAELIAAAVRDERAIRAARGAT